MLWPWLSRVTQRSQLAVPVPARLTARLLRVNSTSLNSTSFPCLVASLFSTHSTASSITTPSQASSSSSSSSSSSFDARIVPYLACPLSKGELRYEPPHLVSVITQDNEEAGQRRVIRVAYPIEQGIPMLLTSRGRILDETVEVQQS